MAQKRTNRRRVLNQGREPKIETAGKPARTDLRRQQLTQDALLQDIAFKSQQAALERQLQSQSTFYEPFISSLGSPRRQ